MKKKMLVVLMLAVLSVSAYASFSYSHVTVRSTSIDQDTRI